MTDTEEFRMLETIAWLERTVEELQRRVEELESRNRSEDEANDIY